MTAKTITLNGKHYDPVTGHLVTQKDLDKSATTKVAVRPNHTKHHAAQSSTTLMRRAVKKPKAVATVATLPVEHSISHKIEVKHTLGHTDSARLERAQSVAQSPHVSRYAHHKDVTVSYGSVPVQPEPKTAETEAPVAPPPLQAAAHTDMFERAIERATNYVDIAAERVHFNKKKRTHVLHMAGGLTALALLAGFAFYQNSSVLQIKAAGLRAGLASSTPDLKATGFGYAGVQTVKDSRVLGLTDQDGNYQLRQTPTNWSGAAMIESVASTDASGKLNYEVMSFAGNTVYHLSNGSYTWVKNGIWFQFAPTEGQKDVPLDKLSALIQNS